LLAGSLHRRHLGGGGGGWLDNQNEFLEDRRHTLTSLRGLLKMRDWESVGFFLAIIISLLSMSVKAKVATGGQTVEFLLVSRFRPLFDFGNTSLLDCFNVTVYAFVWDNDALAMSFPLSVA
jgi:hypothetical protein